MSFKIFILVICFYQALGQDIVFIQNYDETSVKPSYLSNNSLIYDLFVRFSNSYNDSLYENDSFVNSFDTSERAGFIEKYSSIGMKVAYYLRENKINPEQYKAPREFCPYKEIDCTKFNQRYRSIDGSCNNLRNTQYGMSQTPLKRLLKSEYADGLNQPKIKSKSTKSSDLPNPRIVSLKIHDSLEIFNKFTQLTTFFGQMIDHDITLTIPTTNSKGLKLNCFCENKNPNCINIQTPPEDTMNKDQKCMFASRSSLTFNSFDCRLSDRGQMNFLTHWLDLSSTYGSTQEKSNELRLFKYGLLNVSFVDGYKREYMPYFKDRSSCSKVLSNGQCFNAGDIRSSDDVLLTTLHTIFVREHNRVATSLVKVLKDTDDERIFQEARRIVIAEYQHILFNEWLPLIIGRKIAKLYNLLPLEKNNYLLSKYNPKLNPAIYNEFASAAFRFGHTLVQKTFQQVDINNKQLAVHQLDNVIFNATPLFTNGGIDAFARGSIIDRMSIYDRHITDGLNHRLFENKIPNPSTKRFSLISLNLNRAREQGLPGYNYYRRLCGLNYAKNFDDLKTNHEQSTIELFKIVYSNVDDIDLFTGGISEKSVSDGILGATFSCIIARQFYDLKFSDRFYYENGDSKQTRFTLDQLKEIKKTTMAQLLCNNVDINTIQQYPLLTANTKTNKIQNCDEILSNTLSFNKWKEDN